jgi:hypothetical protein
MAGFGSPTNFVNDKKEGLKLAPIMMAPPLPQAYQDNAGIDLLLLAAGIE